MAALAEDAARRITSDALGLPAQDKEAYAFALLGFLTAHGLPGTLSSATGARRASVLGSLTPGDRRPARRPGARDDHVTALAIVLGLAIGMIVGAVGGGGAILALPVLVYVLGEPVGPASTATLVVVVAGRGDRRRLARPPRPRLLAARVHVRRARRDRLAARHVRQPRVGAARAGARVRAGDAARGGR